MNDNVSEKQIILKPNQRPQFIGSWTIGEVRQMAIGLLTWLDSIPLADQVTVSVKEKQNNAV